MSKFKTQQLFFTALATLLIILAFVTIASAQTTKPDTLIVLKLSDFKKLSEIIQEQKQPLNDAQKLRIEMDLAWLSRRVKMLVDSGKVIPKK